MTTLEKRRMALKSILGDKAGIPRERNPVITEGGRLNRELATRHTLECIAETKPQCELAKFGSAQLGKSTIVAVDPKTMVDFSLASKLSAIAAENPAVQVRGVVTTEEYEYTRDGLGELLTKTAGGIVGLTADEADIILAAAKLGKHGVALFAELDGANMEDKEPAKQKRAKKAEPEAPTADAVVAESVATEQPA